MTCDECVRDRQVCILGTFRPQNAMRSCYANHYVVFVSSRWKSSDFICWPENWTSRAAPKLYIPSTRKICFILWHKKLIVSAVKYWIMDYFFHFSSFCVKIHSNLNKFTIKKNYCYIVSDLKFLLEIQAILPKTSPFLSAQMAVLSSCFFKCL